MININIYYTAHIVLSAQKNNNYVIPSKRKKEKYIYC